MPHHRYTHTCRHASEGLPSDTVRSVIQTQDGYIWIGTDAGLARFNGMKLSVFGTTLPELLEGRDIRALVEDNQGVLWIATDDGLWTRKDNDFSSLPTGGKNDITALLSNDRAMWVGTRGGGLLRFVDGKLNVPEELVAISNKTITSLAKDSNGAIWIGTASGLFRHQEDSLEKIRDGIRVTSLFLDTRNNLWMGTNRNGLQVRRGHVWHESFLKSQAMGHVNAFHEYGDNWVWLGTGEGLFVIDGIEQLKQSAQLWHPGQSVSVILEDTENNLWIGTSGDGVCCYKRGAFESYNARDGLPNGAVAFVPGDSDGSVFSPSTGSLYQLKRDRFESNSVFPFRDDKSLTALLKTADESYYVGRPGGRLEIHRDGALTELWSPGTADIEILAEDTRRTVWAATGDMLYHLENEALIPHDVKVGYLRGITVLFSDIPGDLWVGTDGVGLHRFCDGVIKTYTTDDGLSSNHIESLYRDRDGFLWVGTSRGGLNLFKNDRFTDISSQVALPDKAVLSITEDDRGGLWLQCQRGIVRVDKSELLASVDKKSGPNVSFHLYGEKDGLLVPRPSRIKGSRWWKDRSGRIWFAMSNGVAVVDPTKLKEKRNAPILHIEKFIVDGHEWNTKRYIELAPDAESIEIHCAGLNYFAPEEVRYSYRLERRFGDPDIGLVEMGTDPIIRLGNITPDAYRLTVFATNGSNETNEARAAIGFRKRAHPHQRIEFYILVFIVLSAAVVGVYYLRIRVLEKRQTELLATNRQLETVDKLKTRILTTTSHELRTPLNGIIGLTDSLLDGATGELGGDTRYNLGIIRSSGTRLLTLVNNLLDVARLRQRSVALTLQPVSLHSTVNAAFRLLGVIAADKSLNLENRIPKDLPAVWADRDRVLQILNNLVGNAIKFTSKGEISVSATAHEEMIEVVVSDTGIGIPKEMHETIFKAFEQVSDVQKSIGTGVGLSIVHKLVELHGGSVRVESSRGEGATFVFTLPRSAELAVNGDIDEVGELESACEAKEKEHVPIAHSHPPDGAVVLSVDDDTANQQVIKNHLTGRGYDVRQVFDGEQALAHLKANDKPDLVLLDIMMPGMSGYDVCRAIRKKFTAAELPVIMVTAKDSVEDLVEGFKRGANDYLPKPFSKDELFTRIRSHLSLSNEIAAVRDALEDDVAKSEEEIEEMRDELKIKYTKIGIDEAGLREIAKKARNHMEENRPYRDDSLSIVELASQIKVSPNHLSYALNSVLFQNFFTFVNTYRLKEVTHRLSSPKDRDESILIIAFDAGFKSKSTFNSFFKKTLQKTPSQYRKSALG
ncbi:MAG: response regulator [Deltaproteobacteria bacterium]|nr:response regulator [Deltaproteobacteria bacterium]